jgi:hypothetical protein
VILISRPRFLLCLARSRRDRVVSRRTDNVAPQLKDDLARRGLPPAVERRERILGPESAAAPIHAGGSEYGDVKAAANVLGVSTSFLNKARMSGLGPPFYKFGERMVRYHLPTLPAWAAAQARRSTSDQAAIDDRGKRGIPEVAERRECVAGPDASASADPAIA